MRRGRLPRPRLPAVTLRCGSVGLWPCGSTCGGSCRELSCGRYGRAGAITAAYSQAGASHEIAEWRRRPARRCPGRSGALATQLVAQCCCMRCSRSRAPRSVARIECRRPPGSITMHSGTPPTQRGRTSTTPPSPLQRPRRARSRTSTRDPRPRPHRPLGPRAPAS